MARHARSSTAVSKPAVRAGLDAAIAACRIRGAQMTPLRESALAALWASHRPLGAYELREILASQMGRAVAAPSIYRTLEFLCEYGVAARIESLNAYIACARPEHDHTSVWFVCEQCGHATEVANKKLERLLAADAESLGFAIDHHTVELSGSCAECRASGT